MSYELYVCIFVCMWLCVYENKERMFLFSGYFADSTYQYFQLIAINTLLKSIFRHEIIFWSFKGPMLRVKII